MDFAALPSYMKWANRRALRMLLCTASAGGLPILTHLLATEQIWAARVTGAAPPCKVWPTWTLNDCAGAVSSGAVQWRIILRERSTNEVITYHNSKGEAFASSIGDVALHVFAHGAYHRGQISQIVHAAGGEILDTDFIFYRRLKAGSGVGATEINQQQQ